MIYKYINTVENKTVSSILINPIHPIALLKGVSDKIPEFVSLPREPE